MDKITLADVIAGCGLRSADFVALRVRLHPEDATDVLPDLEALFQYQQFENYMRMRDGQALGAAPVVLCFADMGSDQARLITCRQFRARRPGIAPGDLIYDPDLVDLLHNFIGRAQDPIFYDLFEPEGYETTPWQALRACFGQLIVAWNRAVPDVRPAADGGLHLLSKRPHTLAPVGAPGREIVEVSTGL